MATDYPVSDRLFACAAKVETTYNVDASPTFATNAVRLAAMPEINQDFEVPNERDAWYTGGLGELFPDEPKGRFHEIDLVMPLFGNAAAYASVTATPNVDAFLRAAGYAVAYTTASVVYTPTDSPATGLTVYTQKDGKEYKTTGAIVTEWQIATNWGEFPLLEVKLFGVGVTVAEVDISTVTLPTTLPPKFVGATLAISGYTPICRRFELSGGLSFATRGDGRASGGLAGYRITRRQPELRFVNEHADITDYNPEADHLNRTQRTIDMQIGSTQYNFWLIDVDDARVMEVLSESEDGLAMQNVRYRAFTPSSGQEFQIKFK